MNPNPKLKGQAALVTGANSEIGKGVALARDGAKVVVNYVTHPEAADDVVNQIIKEGGTAIALKADVSKEHEVQTMFKAMYKEFGTIDILVNNAGLQKDSAFADMKIEDWQLVLNVNLTGQFLCAREAVREFLRRGIVKEKSCAAGKIICMSSVHQVIPWAGHVNYATSKGGIDMMMKSIAQEMAPKRIRVNSIAPRCDRNAYQYQSLEYEVSVEKTINTHSLRPYRCTGRYWETGRLAGQ